jgi:threonylcarbamoyladenosine tRNA methylthiotransferase MtaB
MLKIRGSTLDAILDQNLNADLPALLAGSSPETIYVKTLGCKVNTFDSHAIENQFKAIGYQLVDDPALASISVVNTCSVTENADKEARYLARRFRRSNADSLIVMTGCYAQTDSSRLMTMNEIDVIVPNEAKEHLVPFVQEQLRARREGRVVLKMPDGIKAVSENKQSHFKSSLTLFDRADSSQTRAFVKIQDGCNGFCAYCLIPYARGASRSVPANEALSEIKRLVDSGTREIVLTGIHIGDYGLDHLPEDQRSGADPFVEFMKQLFDIDGLTRVRISSLEPAELTENLIKVLAEHKDKFCDHFHLPLQAGHDDVLRRMRRKYDTAWYREACDMARAYFPDVCLGADIIPGFPGETDEQFAAGCEFIESVSLDYLHVFPYSRRPNTSADKMPGHLDAQIIKARALHLRDMSKVMRKAYMTRFLGKTLEVLWENRMDDLGRPVGTTRNYLNVAASRANEQTLQGLTSNWTIKGFINDDRMLGMPVINQFL